MGAKSKTSTQLVPYSKHLTFVKDEHLSFIREMKSYYEDIVYNLYDKFELTTSSFVIPALRHEDIATGLIYRIHYNVPFSETYSAKIASSAFNAKYEYSIHRFQLMDIENCIKAFGYGQFFYVDESFTEEQMIYNLCWSPLALNFDLVLRLLNIVSGPSHKIERYNFFNRVLMGFLARDNIYYPLNDYMIMLEASARTNITNFLEKV